MTRERIRRSLEALEGSGFHRAAQRLDEVSDLHRRLIPLVLKTPASREFMRLASVDRSMPLPVDEAIALVRSDVPDLWNAPEPVLREVVEALLHFQREV